jgi:cysteine desulfurase/selenocysteine lyase
LPTTGIDIDKVRAEFPVLKVKVRGGMPLVYLDNAASTQKPQSVIDTVTRFYTERYSNVHRGVHQLSELATTDFERTRGQLKEFINANDEREVIFTHGSTEAINLVAYGMTDRISSGDEILITEMEHHTNIVPWQMLCQRTGATLRVAPINDDGDLILERFEELLCERTRIVAMSHTSNALGTRNPIEQLAPLIKQTGAWLLLDAAQAAPHERLDVQKLGCDFLVLSGHKMYGPTGVGILWGRFDCLDSLPPFLGGGDMIETVTFEKTTYRGLPNRLEAGTPDIAGVIGLSAAIDFIERLGIDAIGAHEQELLAYGTDKLNRIEGLRLLGTAQRKAAILSFVVDGVHAHDLGTALDLDGVAIRAGHHCAQPLMAHFGVAATARASIGVFNNRNDIDTLATSIQSAIEVFAA